MVADEIAGDRVDKKDLLGHFLLGVEPEIYKNLGVVVVHCLRLSIEKRCVETIHFDVRVLK